MWRYVRLFFIQLRASLQLAMAYRVDVLFEGLTALFWSATTFVPLFVAFHQDRPVAGWTFDESLVILGLFLLLKSVLEGAVNPSLLSVVEHIRQGTLDFVLLKPADAQFLVSTSKFQPSASVGLLGAGTLLTIAFVRLGFLPSLTGILIALALLVTALVLLYSIWIMVISAAFYVIRVDNLAYLFTSIFDAARWPSTVFKGVLHIVFTFIIPLALMTTYPAEALLGRFTATQALFSFAGAAVFAVIARGIWRSSLAKYTSASS